MVGQGVLRECLLSPAVESVLVIGRSTVGNQDPKLSEILVPDLADISSAKSPSRVHRNTSSKHPTSTI